MLKRPSKLLLISSILLLILYLIFVYHVKTDLDNLSKELNLDIEVDVYSLSYQQYNETTGKFLEFIDGLDGITDNYSIYGYLYIAQPQTDWVITSQYINVILFFNGFDSRYFAGFSIPRTQFILALPNYTALNISPPPTDEVLVVVDNRYRFSSDPIFKIIRESRHLAFYYPEVFSLKLNYSLKYMDTIKLAEHLGLPEEVKYKAGRYNFRDSPPVYLLVNRRTYLDLIAITEPVVFGKLFTISFKPDISSLDYRGKIVKVNRVVNELHRLGMDTGVDRVVIRTAEYDLFRDRATRKVHDIASYYIIPLISMLIIPIIINYRIRRRRPLGYRSSNLYPVIFYYIAILSSLYLAGLNLYLPIAETFIFLFTPLPTFIYLIFKAKF